MFALLEWAPLWLIGHFAIVLFTVSVLLRSQRPPVSAVAWLMTIGVENDRLQWPFAVWATLAGALAVYYFVDVGCALLRAGGQSLHDQLFDTRVVLVGPNQ